MKIKMVSVLIVLLLVQLACSSNSEPEKVGEISVTKAAETQPAQAPESKPTEKPAEPTATVKAVENYNVGDIVKIGDVILVVLGWEDLAGNDFAKPDDGKKFIAVEIVIVNNTKSSLSISSLLQMTLKDETGQKYEPDFSATTLAKSSPDGELAPGEKKRGQIGFQVPADVKGMVFVFDESLFGAGKVFVAMGDSPAIVEAPAEIMGETNQEIFKVGETVNIQNVNLTVNSISNPDGNEFTKPEDGKKFLVVDVTIENTSTEVQNISSLLQMSVKDGTGQEYAVDFAATTIVDGASPDGELAAGEKVRGQVGFQVPADAKGLVFVFDASVFGSGKIMVGLE